MLEAGLTPWEIRTLSLRKAFQVMRSLQDRKRFTLQQTAFLAAYQVNTSWMAPKRAVKPQDIIPEAFPKEDKEAWLRKMYDRHNERVEREREARGDG